MNPPLLDGLHAEMIDTGRLQTHVITKGDPTGEAVLLIHGNASAARFWEELMQAFPEQYYVIAPDLRGYGRSEPLPLDGSRGMRDFSDDLYRLVQTMGLESVHLVGWSLGGNIAMQFAIDHPTTVRTLTLIAAGSPYGFGGTHGLDGKPNSDDYAGSGGGTANAEFVQHIKDQDRGADSQVSPRNVMNAFYFKPPFRSPREDVFVDELLLVHCSPQNYPGDLVPSANWPMIGPGTGGVNNALSPKYCNQHDLVNIEPKPPILWIRGDSDQIVSDMSLFDLCVLGKLGMVPGYPGEATHPPQPMVSQLRAVLDEYAMNGGDYKEVILADCGHSPHIEKPEEFQAEFFEFLSR